MRLVLMQIKKIKNYNIEIYVHSNDLNSIGENKKLSIRRGLNFKNILVSNYIDDKSISVFSKIGVESELLNHLEFNIYDKLENIRTDYKIISTDILFDDKKDKITPLSLEKLESIRDRLKSLGKIDLDIVSYSNEFRSALKNRELTVSRANFIQKYLKDSVDGVSVGYGNGSFRNSDVDIFSKKLANQKVDLIIKTVKERSKKIIVQMGAFSSYERAMYFKTKFLSIVKDIGKYKIGITESKSAGVYQVSAFYFDTREEALNFINKNSLNDYLIREIIN